ncbi:MAG: hypothetical protein MUP21_01300 [Dehalococcoidia bacterium]|nr:hypothetical protein [Dehalococcoidia bacterium]
MKSKAEMRTLEFICSEPACRAVRKNSIEHCPACGGKHFFVRATSKKAVAQPIASQAG